MNCETIANSRCFIASNGHIPTKEKSFYGLISLTIADFSENSTYYVCSIIFVTCIMFFCSSVVNSYPHRQIHPFVKGEKKSLNDSIREAVKEAENALQLSVKERSNLIKCVPSDDEDVDEDISDDILMECDLDSLENGNDTKKEQDSDDNDEVTGKKVLCRLQKAFMIL